MKGFWEKCQSFTIIDPGIISTAPYIITALKHAKASVIEINKIHLDDKKKLKFSVHHSIQLTNT